MKTTMILKSKLTVTKICRLVHLFRKENRLFSSLTELDVDYYLDQKNKDLIAKNVSNRKGVGDIAKVISLKTDLEKSRNDPKLAQQLQDELARQLMKLPNRTHPAVANLSDPLEVKLINPKPDFGQHKPLEFSEITRKLNLMRTDQLGHTCGPKSYYFLGDLAEMEEALIKYSVSLLLKKGFQLVSVPDILPGHVLESCGMTIDSDRTQLYQLAEEHFGQSLFLSGTAEMALAGMLADEVLHEEELPLKLAAVSRCYRAETSSVLEQRGIYRVHQFTKVEMFIASSPEQSEEMLEYLRSTEEELFTPLGIHMKVLDMPPHELGAPAYRKYDVEAWMPGRNSFGEISSCSNCTDYQSRRLSIKYKTNSKEMRFVHTLNGTACAVPRMLIALLETYQTPDGKVQIPQVLRKYMDGKEFLTKRKSIPELKLSKIKKT